MSRRSAGDGTRGPGHGGRHDDRDGRDRRHGGIGAGGALVAGVVVTAMQLPADTVARMELYGRTAKDPHAGADVDAWTTFHQPYLPLIEQDAAGFVDALAGVCRPAGGWAVVGGGTYVLDCVAGQAHHPQALAMLDEGIDHQLRSGSSQLELSGVERERLRTREPSPTAFPSAPSSPFATAGPSSFPAGPSSPFATAGAPPARSSFPAVASSPFPTTTAGPSGCPGCGRPRTPGTAFCTGCGHRFDGDRTLPAAPAAASSPWFTRPTTAILAALVAVLAVSGVVAAVVHLRSADTTPVAAPPTSVAATGGSGTGGSVPRDLGGSTPSFEAPADPATQLTARAAADAGSVEGLVGYWVPQLSSKRPGLVADGVTYDDASILAEHQALRTTYPDARLLWTGDYANYRGRDFWATVAGEPMSSAAAANAWCDAQGLDGDHCYAVRLTHTGGPEGNSVQRPR